MYCSLEVLAVIPIVVMVTPCAAVRHRLHRWLLYIARIPKSFTIGIRGVSAAVCIVWGTAVVDPPCGSSTGARFTPRRTGALTLRAATQR